MARTTGRGIFRAVQSFSTDLDGVPVNVVARETLVREGHPLLAGREHFFELVQPDPRFEVAEPSPSSRGSETRG